MPQFIKIRNTIVQLSQVMSVKRTPMTPGADGVMRNYVITVSSEAEPDVKFRRIWVAEDEAAELFSILPKLSEPSTKKSQPKVSKLEDDMEVF